MAYKPMWYYIAPHKSFIVLARCIRMTNGSRRPEWTFSTQNSRCHHLSSTIFRISDPKSMGGLQCLVCASFKVNKSRAIIIWAAFISLSSSSRPETEYSRKGNSQWRRLSPYVVMAKEWMKRWTLFVHFISADETLPVLFQRGRCKQYITWYYFWVPLVIVFKYFRTNIAARFT